MFVELDRRNASPASARRASGSSAVPANVSDTPRGVRSSNFTPSSRSSLRTCSLNAPCVHQAEVAQLAARNAGDHAKSRLRIGYMPASMPATVARAVQRLAAAMPLLETSLEPGSAHELIDAIRAEWLDAVVMPLPAPTAGFRVTPLGDQRAVAALPVSHEHAIKPEIRLEQLAPERIVVLPREANRPLYDGIIAGCRAAGLSPDLVEMPDAHVERALLAVASGAGMALVPESVAERYAAPGVRFVPLHGDTATFATAVLTRRNIEHMPTVAFLRAVSALAKPRAAGVSADAFRSADHGRTEHHSEGAAR